MATKRIRDITTEVTNASSGAFLVWDNSTLNRNEKQTSDNLIAEARGGASASDMTKLAAITASDTEINILDGVTASTAEINKLDGLTASTTELNVLNGISANVSELNLMDGARGAVNGLEQGLIKRGGSQTITGSVVLSNDDAGFNKCFALSGNNTIELPALSENNAGVRFLVTMTSYTSGRFDLKTNSADSGFCLKTGATSEITSTGIRLDAQQDCAIVESCGTSGGYWLVVGGRRCDMVTL